MPIYFDVEVQLVHTERKSPRVIKKYGQDSCYIVSESVSLQDTFNTVNELFGGKLSPHNVAYMQVIKPVNSRLYGKKYHWVVPNRNNWEPGQEPENMDHIGRWEEINGD